MIGLVEWLWRALVYDSLSTTLLNPFRHFAKKAVLRKRAKWTFGALQHWYTWPDAGHKALA